MGLTQFIVRYALTGLSQDSAGRIHRKNYVFAKISRPETAGRFMAPAPAELVEKLLSKGQITAEEARLSRFVPIAEDVTVESDSGGHTDNQPLTAPCSRSSCACGIASAPSTATPGRFGWARRAVWARRAAVAAAFALGAAYVLTGSVNQASIEGGLSPEGKRCSPRPPWAMS
jgi:trans-AT polyketide synthase/acyltransferase/oxidoreductase domain-containing protein